jgi:hypothetical protein
MIKKGESDRTRLSYYKITILPILIHTFHNSHVPLKTLATKEKPLARINRTLFRNVHL